MSLQTRRGVRAGAEPPAAPRPAPARGRAGRARTWRRSWAVALRMARRDVRRHWGRSLVVLVMVGLPSALIVFGLTAIATSQVTGAERIPLELGSAQARLATAQPTRLDQDFGATSFAGGDAEATPIPGYDASASVFDNADAIGALTHGRAVPYAEYRARVTLDGDRTVRLEALAIDGRADLGSRVQLLSGRWPAAPGEVLVGRSSTGMRLPTSGPLDIEAGGETHRVRVVGTALALTSWQGRLDLVSLAPFGTEQGEAGWLIQRDTPVAWPEVRDLNASGLVVLSVDVLRHPPAASALPAQFRLEDASQSARTTSIVAAGGALLLIVTTLLVGPAFAVSAARQRRTLALAASNGASTAQLRHTVLAQAIVLGVAAAGLGTLLGVAGAGVLQGVARARAWSGFEGPFDLPWLQVGFITLAAMLSAVVAALVPARRLGRLDIVGVMRGQNVSPRPSRTVFALGLVLAGAGGAGLLYAVKNQLSEYPVVVATMALVIGSLFLVPLILVGIARTGHHLPVSLRMAARDLGRQRARSAPAVAAVLAAVAAFTVIAVGLSSDTEQARREYLPATLPGDGYVTDYSGDLLPGIERSIGAALPQLQVAQETQYVTHDPWMEGKTPTKPYDAGFLALVPPGCTVARAVADTDFWNAQADAPPADAARADASSPSFPAAPPCQAIGTSGAAPYPSIEMLPADEIVRRLSLTGSDADRVRAGGIVIMSDEPVTTGLAAELAWGTIRTDPVSGDQSAPEVTGSTSVPALVIPLSRENLPLMRQAGALVASSVAEQNHWETQPTGLLLHDPAGPIDAATGERLTTLAGDEVGVGVERGFERPDRLIMSILVGIFVVVLLVVTLTTTALGLAEQQSDQASLAALGATRHTRRAMAAAQAVALSLVGAALGLAVGLVPGIAITYPLTGRSWDPATMTERVGSPTIVIPWLALAAIVLATPAVAGALAATGIRTAPQVTRRAD